MARYPGTYARFLPAEAEKITGVSVTQQRDWRRHRFIASEGEGWSEFTAESLAKLLVLKALADRGIGPAKTHAMASLTADFITDNALAHIEACTGELARAYRDRVVDLAKNAPRFLIWWPDGGTNWANNLEEAFGESASDARYHGGIIILDLAALAWLLVERAGRPLISFTDENLRQHRQETLQRIADQGRRSKNPRTIKISLPKAKRKAKR